MPPPPERPHSEQWRRRRRRRLLLLSVMLVLSLLGGPVEGRPGPNLGLAFTPPTPPPPSRGDGATTSSSSISSSSSSGRSSSSRSSNSGDGSSPSGAGSSPLPFTSKLLESSAAAGSWSTTPTPTSASSRATTAASVGIRTKSTKRPAAAAAAASAVPSDITGPATPTAVTVPGPGPFRLVLDEATDRFAFQTATVRLTQRQAPSPDNAATAEVKRVVRLVGSVHIAEPQYYQALEQAVGGCDVVLYEMITSERNVFRDAEGREQLGVELAATPELRRMAVAHGLEPQLDNMRFFGRRSWFLSDISKERLCALQRARGERALDDGEPEALLDSTNKAPNLLLARFPFLGEMGQMFWEGFTARGRVLPKFQSLRGGLSTAPFRLLRLCMWLTPAPELQLMLLDWARQYPPAGGLSKILRSMVGALVHADFLTLRRLAFSQMLTSSQGVPPPEVLVLERNSKVVLDVAQALQATALEKGGKGGGGGSNGEECVEVAVLYGGLHLKDMEEKLVRHLNFTRDPSSPGNGEDAALEWTTAWTMPAYTSTRPALVAALCVALPLVYLGVGAADWSATFGDIARDIALGGAQAPTRAEATAYEAVREALLYVFRHLAMYYGLSRWIVEWERQLFELK